MIAKTSCQHCTQSLEFEVEHANSFVPCPTCGKQTRLLLPDAKPVAPPKPPPKKWGFSQWFTLALILLPVAVVGFMLCRRDLRAEILPWLGASWLYIVFAGGAAALVALAWLLIVSGALLQFIIWALVGLGLYLCADGFVLRQTVEANKDGTIFQQIYATAEFVGGALVFCGAMILQAVIKFTAKFKPAANP